MWLIPGLGTKVSPAKWCSQKRRKKKKGFCIRATILLSHKFFCMFGMLSKIEMQLVYKLRSSKSVLPKPPAPSVQEPLTQRSWAVTLAAHFTGSFQGYFVGTPHYLHIHWCPFWVVVILINAGIGHTVPQTAPVQNIKGLLIYHTAMDGQLGCFCSLKKKIKNLFSYTGS